MNGLPTSLTHIYHPDKGPFRNLCDLPVEEAEAVLAEIRTSGLRPVRPNYLQRRLAAEDWLLRAGRERIRRARLAHPIYFFLGDFADGRDPSRPASIVLPLCLFPADTITFTYPDSMTSHLFATRPDLAAERRDHHGRVFTLDEIRELVLRLGLPKPNWPRLPGARSDGYIEAQVWDAGPLRAYLGHGFSGVIEASS